ncbi:hypothetical protein A1Q1_05554 [Trichosporon asahii var. asahii CBS 2479]|uniref:Uncharacterized protein n=1 Tax=Trichosporon asahii var. asahii (strain ATCC 90039 / CBS 2479 / JCM 2466 / KCTC 7840 / NBRC 103889/ NCYC 2677 / UAMH 7654) TaxID=1186058 RepID=J5Q8F5_TRIAS|nr:hypothetical protein A1Q1_05554 [Trichosporon asahii var. asahii CBS 2479]EJT46008.1 hypothetical protein A1Q1_05554 [Trichosporon asahii var. asahii CBS 2479]
MPPSTASTPVSSSVDDEVPPPPELAPLMAQRQEQVPELFSLEHLLRQAGYKETRVFTPEAEKLANRYKRQFSDEQAAELADLYASVGQKHNMEIRHMTQQHVPFRSSSSVLRSVVLQDTGANQAFKDGKRTNDREEDESWWGSMLINRAAETVGKSISAMSPPSNEGSLERINIGLGLAKGGNGVRKAKSNWELTRRHSTSGPDQEDIPPIPRLTQSDNTLTTPPRPSSAAFNASAPPAIDSVFTTPPRLTTGQPVFEDDEGFGCPLPMDYEIHGGSDDDMYNLGYTDSSGTNSAASSLGTQIEPRRMSASPPLRDAADVLAGLGLGPSDVSDALASAPPADLEDEDADPHEIALAEQEAAAIGQRILASTVEYDEDSDESDVLSPPPPALSIAPTRRTVAVSKPRTATLPYPATACPTTAIADAMGDLLTDPLPDRTPSVVASETKAKLRAAQSAPMLRSKSQPFLRISPAVVAPPTLQIMAPVICDSQSDMAEDLPPLPTPAPAPQPTGFSSLALRAKKSLKALRSTFWAQQAEVPPPLPTPEDSFISNKTPILTPRLDWAMQGEHFAGWNDNKGHGFGRQRDSIDTMAEIGDPFANAGDVEIDYSKSFFYKPSTPPGPGGSSGHQGSPTPAGRMRRQRSVKTLRAQLLRPVAAPPVPQIPPMYRKGKGRLPTTPPLRNKNTQRPAFEVPKLALHSPNAWEEGRPPVEIILEGDEWDARSIVENWGSGIRRGRGKSPSYYDDDEDFFF